MTERQFLDAVTDLARWGGYQTYHTYDSRRSAPGFPDLVMARAGQPLLCIELKTPRGRLTAPQQGWLTLLGQTQGLRAEVWRPDDWSRIESLFVRESPRIVSL